MKNIYIKTIALVFAISATLIVDSCNEASNNDMKEAKEDMNESNTHLQDAVANANDTTKARMTADWNSFKDQSNQEIASMENQLDMMKLKIENAREEEKTRLRKSYDKTAEKLGELKEKLKLRNEVFEQNMNEMNDTMKSNNESFKREFRHDMNELGGSFKDLFKDNVK